MNRKFAPLRRRKPPPLAEVWFTSGNGQVHSKPMLTDEQVKKVEVLAEVLTISQLADYFGIHRNMFVELHDSDPRVQAAYRKGRANAIVDVGQNLLLQARAGAPWAICFYLKTQAGWRETANIELSGLGGGPISMAMLQLDLSDLTNEELALAEKLMLRRGTPPSLKSIDSAEGISATEGAGLNGDDAQEKAI